LPKHESDLNLQNDAQGAVGFHMMKPSPANLLQKSKGPPLPWVGSNVVSSWWEQQMVASTHAADVPMAAPQV